VFYKYQCATLIRLLRIDHCYIDKVRNLDAQGAIIANCSGKEKEACKTWKREVFQLILKILYILLENLC